MEEFWARFIEPSGQPGLNYWEHFAERLVHLTIIPKNAMVLDIGTYDGNVLFKAMKKMKSQGYGVGADIYNGGFRDGTEVMQPHNPASSGRATPWATQRKKIKFGVLPRMFRVKNAIHSRQR